MESLRNRAPVRHIAGRSPRAFSSFVTLFVSPHILAEIVETTMKLVLDISTALLLGITFCIQTAAVLVSLDVALVGFFQALKSGCAGLLSTLAFWLPSVMERKAVANGIVSTIFNIIWVNIVYGVDEQAWIVLLYSPLLLILSLTSIIYWCLFRLNHDDHPSTSIFSTCISASALCIVLVCISILSVPDKSSVSVILLLRCAIDAVASCVCMAIADKAEGDTSVGNTLVEMSLSLFWATVSLHQLLLTQKSSRLRFLMLLVHDFIAMSGPTRKLILKVMHDRYISQKFRKLNREELEALSCESCPVCLNDQNEDSVRLPCQHVLHRACLSRILQQGTRHHISRCPMCRAALVDQPAREISITGGPFRVSNVIRIRIIPQQRLGMENSFRDVQAGQAERALDPSRDRPSQLPSVPANSSEESGFLPVTRPRPPTAFTQVDEDPAHHELIEPIASTHPTSAQNQQDQDIVGSISTTSKDGALTDVDQSTAEDTMELTEVDSAAAAEDGHPSEDINDAVSEMDEETATADECDDKTPQSLERDKRDFHSALDSNGDETDEPSAKRQRCIEDPLE